MKDIPRFDKYDSEVSGFRAALGATLTLTAQSVGPVGVSLDANGRVIVGGAGGGTPIEGLILKNMPLGAIIGNATLGGITAPGSLAGDTIDVMIRGEIVDCVGLTAGTVYWVDGTTGALAAGAAGTGAQPGSGSGSTAGSKKIGFTVEATRLVVNVAV